MTELKPKDVLRMTALEWYRHLLRDAEVYEETARQIRQIAARAAGRLSPEERRQAGLPAKPKPRDDDPTCAW
jgi:hypothetical protein